MSYISFICTPCCIHTCNMTCSYVRHDLFTRAPWLIHIYVTLTYMHVYRDTLTPCLSLCLSPSFSVSLSLSLSLSFSVSVCLYLFFARMPPDQSEVLEKEEKPTERKTKWKMKRKITHSPQCVSRSIHLSLSLSLSCVREFALSLAFEHLCSHKWFPHSKSARMF